MPVDSNHAPAREVILTAARAQSPESELKCHGLFELIDTCRTLEHDLRHELARSELTEQGFHVLAHLVRINPEPMTPSKVSDLLDVPRPAISQILGRLEISGLITRERSDGDRRSLTVKITEKGRLAFTTALAHCLQSINRLMAAVDPQDLNQLDQVCTRLRQGSFQPNVS